MSYIGNFSLSLTTNFHHLIYTFRLALKTNLRLILTPCSITLRLGWMKLKNSYSIAQKNALKSKVWRQVVMKVQWEELILVCLRKALPCISIAWETVQLGITRSLYPTRLQHKPFQKLLDNRNYSKLDVETGTGLTSLDSKVSKSLLRILLLEHKAKRISTIQVSCHDGSKTCKNLMA